MTNHHKVVAIGDPQLPYGDDRAIDLMFEMMKWWKPTDVVFVGDIDDQLEYSTFSDGTTDEFFNRIKKEAVESPLPIVKENAFAARSFYTQFRINHKKARLFSCLGNHDIRIYKYMDKKAPAYKDQITPDFLYDFNNLGIDWIDYTSPPVELFPGTYFHHGNSSIQAGAAVRVDIDNFGVSLVRGHDHMGGVVYKTFPITERTLFGLACGHLCDPKAYGLRYTNNPTWQLGFGVLHVYGEHVHPQFIHIKPDYTAVLDGKLFQG